MKLLICVFLLFINISFAQTNDKFLNNFLFESELNSENILDNYTQFNFSNILTKTVNNNIYGIIGKEHQRILIKFISISKNPNNENQYLIYGKSSVKDIICEFKGIITLTEIKEVKELHFGVDNEYKNKGIKSQGILIADYEFKENSQQKYSGVFKGKLYSKWYLSSKNKIEYDNIEKISDKYTNNAFVGVWKSYKTEKEKICNWADYRVPNANTDFDIGAGEFSVSEKYWNKGWLDIALKNQVYSLEIKTTKEKEKVKKWWE